MLATTPLSPTEILYNDGKISLKIRPLHISDASILNTAVKESLNNLLPFMDWAHEELSQNKQYTRIIASNQNYLNGIEYDFAVFDSSGNFIASASFHPSKTRNKKCFEIGYWTHTNYCNKGIATLVTKILTFVSFEFMRCDRIEIGCNKANYSSKRVIEKCEYLFEGKIRNYFSKPTEKMLENMYSPERTYLAYGLTSEDLSKITWYSEIRKYIKIR